MFLRYYSGGYGEKKIFTSNRSTMRIKLGATWEGLHTVSGMVNLIEVIASCGGVFVFVFGMSKKKFSS